MGMQNWAREMSRYNRWQNTVLFDLVTEMSDVERKKDRGMFFKSIHHSLDHILMVDSRLIDLILTSEPPDQPFEPEVMVYDSFVELERKRVETDEAIINLADSHPDSWFDDIQVFNSPLTRKPRELPRHFYLAQLFNHATHHRAQITGEFPRAGLAYGSTDLPMNPDTLYQA